MPQLGRLRYTSAEEGVVYLFPDFAKYPPVTRMDIIRDWMADLETAYAEARKDAGFDEVQIVGG